MDLVTPFSLCTSGIDKWLYYPSGYLLPVAKNQAELRD
jgi:hypothetical protein